MLPCEITLLIIAVFSNGTVCVNGLWKGLSEVMVFWSVLVLGRGKVLLLLCLMKESWAIIKFQITFYNTI